MSCLSSLREFLRSSLITPQVNCLFTQGGHALLNYFESFLHLAKGGCPCYKTPSSSSSRGLLPICYLDKDIGSSWDWRDLATLNLVIPHRFAPNSCSKTWVRLCGLEFVIPLRIAPSSCSTTWVWLCRLVLQIVDRLLFGLHATIGILSVRS